MGLLDGKVAIVTGAGSGVGEGMARAMAAQGAAVVIAARRTETGDPVAAAIVEQGGAALSVRCDVTVRADVDAAVAAAVETFGGLDCMVHNALSPTGPSAPPQDVADDAWEGMLRTAVRASFSCAQAAFPQLRARRGSLVFMTSAAAVEGSHRVPAYGTVKAAQRGLAKSLAREWGPYGVRVNCIAPVAVSPALLRSAHEVAGLEDRLIGRTPMRRLGDAAEDTGGVVVFLASDLAGYVTGQTVMVDGGGCTAL